MSTPSFWSSVEADAISRDYTYEDYLEFHKRTGCLGAPVVQAAYGLLQQAFQADLCESQECCANESPDTCRRREDGSLYETLLRVNGKRFRCSCGCNVFHQPDAGKPEGYACNSCGARYISEEPT